jgi:beta-glucosidase
VRGRLFALGIPGPFLARRAAGARGIPRLSPLSLPLILLSLLQACGGATSPAPSPSATPGPPGTPDLESLLARMTLDEKVGQMTQADRSYLRSEGDIATYYLGSVLSGGGSSPPDATAAGWAEMYDRYQGIALGTRLRIPIVYGIDAVHGHNNVVGAVIFPHNVGLGCTRDAALVERVARATAEEVTATGLDWTFSPCIAVARDERWGRTYESFGETPELAVELGAAAVRGYQTSILACAKHYVADGGTAGGKDQGDARIDEATLREIHLPGYRAAVGAGVATVMASFSSWNGQKMHGNRYLLTDVLKGELGFPGFLVSDWGGIDQLPGDYAAQVETAVNAGIDMVMVPGRYAEFISTLKALAQSGRVPQSRIDDAVRRILRRKIEAGLFDRPYADRTLLAQVGSDAHRQVAREAVRRSLVLLRNEGPVLPLSKMARRLHVAGKNADDLGNQCGGWTITWQGSSGAITTGTTILQAIRAAVLGGAQVTYSRDGSGAAGADAGVVVIGETPYAEGRGDRTDLSLAAEDVAAVRAVKAAGVPTVVVLVSGRPLILGEVARTADAIVAAWLPGTEGAGVADVLFGDFAPTGRLGHSWPRSMSQVPINVGDPGYDPLYPYGYGLTY